MTVQCFQAIAFKHATCAPYKAAAKDEPDEPEMSDAELGYLVDKKVDLMVGMGGGGGASSTPA